jgi:anthranilate synthase/aminodeoxychorismate synthase-like glutamine amidotransferase
MIDAVPTILLIDNYDSFTYNLADYVQRCGAKCTVFRNDSNELLAAFTQKWDGVLLSPGPKTPQEAGFLLKSIAIFAETTPILGVCLGLQAIGLHYGAILQKAPEPRHGKTSPILHDGSLLFKDLPSSIEVMRYHSLIIANLAETPLEITATSTDDKLIMAIQHRFLPIFGVQFHPESILTPHGLSIIRNWIGSL